LDDPDDDEDEDNDNDDNEGIKADEIEATSVGTKGGPDTIMALLESKVKLRAAGEVKGGAVGTGERKKKGKRDKKDEDEEIEKRFPFRHLHDEEDFLEQEEGDGCSASDGEMHSCDDEDFDSDDIDVDNEVAAGAGAEMGPEDNGEKEDEANEADLQAPKIVKSRGLKRRTVGSPAVAARSKRTKK
jgi:hypothetical protein